MSFLRVHNLRLDLDDDRELLRGLAAERLGVAADTIAELRLARRSLDARHNRRLQWIYSVDVSLPDLETVGPAAGASPVEDADPLAGIEPGREPLPGRVTIVGCGPAGLFAAYVLGQYGYAPLLIERGPALQGRVREVRAFWKGGAHNPESNLLFGEGGAGTFSDGKLTCRSSNPLTPQILKIMVEHRAPGEILYEARPHIGTDRLRAVLVTMRRRMQDLGVEFRFDARMDDLVLDEGDLRAVRIGEETLETGPLLLGIGHSARDTYEMLLQRGVRMEFKPFQLGVRTEHPQELIDQSQHGPSCGHPKLGPAEYVLARDQGRKKRRPVYSFCMCPGGIVIPSVSEPGKLCTNGMSNHKRSSGWANSAFVTTLEDREVPGTSPLKGMHFQRRFEGLSFRLGGDDYSAPAQSIPDFIRGVQSGREFQTTYPRGYVEADLREVLPPAVARAIRSAFKEFDRKLEGFASDRGTVTGPEARGSSPVRIVREESTLESVNVRNLYPIGEGSGHAGGIVSAAVDGVRAAMVIIQRYAPPG